MAFVSWLLAVGEHSTRAGTWIYFFSLLLCDFFAVPLLLLFLSQHQLPVCGHSKSHTLANGVLSRANTFFPRMSCVAALIEKFGFFHLPSVLSVCLFFFNLDCTNNQLIKVCTMLFNGFQGECYPSWHVVMCCVCYRGRRR